MGEEGQVGNASLSALESKIDDGIRSTTIDLGIPLGAIWTGVFGFSFAAQYLNPDDLFLLIVLALCLGTVLTIAVLIFYILIQKIMRGIKESVSLLLVEVDTSDKT